VDNITRWRTRKGTGAQNKTLLNEDPRKKIDNKKKKQTKKGSPNPEGSRPRADGTNQGESKKEGGDLKTNGKDPAKARVESQTRKEQLP